MHDGGEAGVPSGPSDSQLPRSAGAQRISKDPDGGEL